MINGYLASFLLALLVTSTIVTSSDHLDAEIRWHLKRLNKPALTSIKSPDGDIIDCVPITKQPALDHPLLKNHSIQMRPSSRPKGTSTGNKDPLNNKKEPKAITQLWHLNGKCPENTVPIRRTRKEDFQRATDIENYGKKSQNSIPKPQSGSSTIGHEHAVMYSYGDYYGTKAWINLWKPLVEKPNEFSLAQLWVVAGSGSDINTIEVGWQVYPRFYGDNNPRLFIYWTSDGYQRTGCYNHLCSGFVQTNNDIAIGGSFRVASNYKDAQYVIILLVWKDPTSGNWWLDINGKDIGYWPASLFTHLSDKARLIEWGGEIVDDRSRGQHTYTQMGSGHFAEEGFGKSSFIMHIETVDGSNTYREPGTLGVISAYQNCYNVKYGDGDSSMGTHFYFGGPGRNPNCP
ncbi:PREDICTED: uncharacterized protein LOC104801734 [Tarenaya hassleriana]|uniref:uncharacterized protein LOC104801734 n=1 Tax=Tarenaya hassleriana TaxID=28532 RepID=UPI00053C6F8B|nr:PREDICTED: uncharacterized protein LOC104801734 [Tarenaya hassleriana]